MERYGQINGVEIYQLHKELNAISQENLPVVEYYIKLKQIWEDLDSIDPIPSCDCGALESCTCYFLKRLLSRENVAKLIQFLMGLNSGYEHAKENVLSMDPLPPINKTLNILQKVERQKQVHDAAEILAEATAYANSRSPSQHDYKKAKTDDSAPECSYCHHLGHVRDSCFKLHSCTICGRKGHLADKCFKNPKNKGKGKLNSKRTANHAALVISEPSEAGFTPFDEPSCSYAAEQPDNFSFPPAMIDGLVDTVLTRVCQAMADKNQNGASSSNTASSANFAGRQGRMLVAVKAATDNSDSSTSLIESVQNVWDKPEDRVAVIGLGLTAIIAIWASTNFVSAIDKLPVIPGFLEFVGILYSSWFVYRYLLFKPDREELFRSVNKSVSNILGQ